MKSFPMFIRTSGHRVVVSGGGERAAQKRTADPEDRFKTRSGCPVALHQVAAGGRRWPR
jgi:hypothetical protein